MEFLKKLEIDDEGHEGSSVSNDFWKFLKKKPTEKRKRVEDLDESRKMFEKIQKYWQSNFRIKQSYRIEDGTTSGLFSEGQFSC